MLQAVPMGRHEPLRWAWAGRARDHGRALFGSGVRLPVKNQGSFPGSVRRWLRADWGSRGPVRGCCCGGASVAVPMRPGLP